MKNKIYKLFSIILAVAITLSCCVIGFTASAIETEHTYYISATGNDSNDGTTHGTPFRTIGGALTVAIDNANTNLYNSPDNTVTFKLLTPYYDEFNNIIESNGIDLTGASGIKYNFKLVITTNELLSKQSGLTMYDDFIAGGDIEFKNVILRFIGETKQIILNGKNVKMDDNVQILDMGTGSYFITGSPDTSTVTYNTPQSIYYTNKATGSSGFQFFTIGSVGTTIYKEDYNFIYDAPSISQVIMLDAVNKNHNCTVYKNMNLNFISASSIRLTTRNYFSASAGIISFNAGAAFQMINSTGNTIDYSDVKDYLPANKFIITNLTDVKDIISFTQTAGTYDVKDGYNVTAIASDKSTIDSKDGKLVLENPGEYKLITAKTPDSATNIYSDYIVNRGDGLKNTYLKLANKKDITVAYFGGTVTGGAGTNNSESDSWRAKISSWLTKNFPLSKIENINLAIGGTGTTLGLYRTEDSLLAADPDLVFIDFAMEDEYDGLTTAEIKRNFETIVRKIREEKPKCDIVTIIAAEEIDYNNNLISDVYNSVAAYDEISEAYGIPSIYIGKALADNIKDFDDLEKYFTEDFYPNNEAHEIYYQVIKEYLNNNLLCSTYTGTEVNHAMPSQVCPYIYNFDELNIIKVDQDFIDSSNMFGGCAFGYNDSIIQYGANNDYNLFVGAGENIALDKYGSPYMHPDGYEGAGTLVFDFIGSELSILSKGHGVVGYDVSIDGEEAIFVEKYDSYIPLILATNLDNDHHIAEITVVYDDYSYEVPQVDWIYAFLSSSKTYPPHDHIYDEYISDLNATCTEDGTKSAECLICGEINTIPDVGSAGHLVLFYLSDNNATCTEDGTKTGQCLVCGKKDTITDNGSAFGHLFTNYVSDNNATCTKNGTKTAVCDRKNCNVTNTTTDVGSVLGHSFTNYVSDNNATCTKDGTKTAVCDHENCNVTNTTTDVGSGLGHLFTNYVSNNNATCTQDGTKTAVCDRDGCNETSTVIDEGSAKGHKYSDVITVKATTSTDGEIITKCSVCGEVSGTKKISKISSVKLSTTSYTYNGKAQKPTVTVKDSLGKTLKNGTDYTVTYPSGLKKVGSYTVKVTFKGNYSGTKSLTFKINPKGTKISKLTAATKSLKVSIKKQSSQTTGYEVQYSTSKKFTSAKTKTIKSYKTTSYTIKSLKAKTTYYVRVRTYKTVNGKKYYSGWSTYKYKKTK